MNCWWMFIVYFFLLLLCLNQDVQDLRMYRILIYQFFVNVEIFYHEKISIANFPINNDIL